MKLMFFGDIIGRAGRRAIAQVLPDWQKTYQPDFIIGNTDNLAHGKGVTKKVLEEMMSMGFNGFTAGDHAFDNGVASEVFADDKYPIARPANFEASAMGRGFFRLPGGSRGDLLIINLMGQVFLKEPYTSPFTAIDEILATEKTKGNLVGVLVDLHAEATSEKIAFGWYVDGRVTAVIGTHTHVPTADEWIMPQGTAYLTDAGMIGVRESVIGVKKEQSLQRFLTSEQVRLEPVEEGEVLVCAVLIEFDPATMKAQKIERLVQAVTII